MQARNKGIKNSKMLARNRGIKNSKILGLVELHSNALVNEAQRSPNT